MVAAKQVTPSDDTVVHFGYLVVMGNSGNVAVRRADGSVTTYTGLLSGVWIPVGNAVGVNATGTTATNILVA